MDDPWFTYLRGRGRLHVTPRDAKGWAATILFAVALTLPALTVPWMIEISPWLLLINAAVVIVGIVLFVKWAKGRSQIVDLDELNRDYAEFQQWKKRNRR